MLDKVEAVAIKVKINVEQSTEVQLNTGGTQNQHKTHIFGFYLSIITLIIFPLFWYQTYGLSVPRVEFGNESRLAISSVLAFFVAVSECLVWRYFSVVLKHKSESLFTVRWVRRFSDITNLFYLSVMITLLFGYLDFKEYKNAAFAALTITVIVYALRYLIMLITAIILWFNKGHIDIDIKSIAILMVVVSLVHLSVILMPVTLIATPMLMATIGLFFRRNINHPD